MFSFSRLALLFVLPVIGLCADQTPAGISEFFEGTTVTLKLDMPGTQQGLDVFPQRPQPLDLKQYSNRLKQFGVALRNGDSAMVTKVKVKDDNIEFQLAGGGYGTSGDDTDTAVHFTPSEKSGRERDLEGQVKAESNPDRRRSLQRELDEIRSYRERRDRHDREIAEQAAEVKKQQVFARRLQGGSRFNIRVDVRNSGAAVNPQFIMASLAPYVTFSPGGSSSVAVARPAVAPGTEPALTLRKGLTREQVEGVYGPASEAHESNQSGLTVVTCAYLTKDSVVKADFVNGVLVQYSVSSR